MSCTKVNKKFVDIIRTIDEDEEVEDFSENSDIEVEVRNYVSLGFANYSYMFNSFSPLNRSLRKRPILIQIFIS